MSQIRIGIVGTACRRGVSVAPEFYFSTLDHAEHWIEKTFGSWERILLVSGGAAWSDHLAVLLHRRHPDSRLTLMLPEPLSITQEGTSSSARHHATMSRQLGISTVDQLVDLQQDSNVRFELFSGFKPRDSAIAHGVDLLIALTTSIDGTLTPRNSIHLQ